MSSLPAAGSPGGGVGVTQGLLDNVESEIGLATVLGHELGPVVALDHSGRTSALDQTAEDSNDVVRVQEPTRLDPEALPGELVDHGQEPEPSSVERLVGHEVVAPDVVRVEGIIDLGSSGQTLYLREKGAGIVDSCRWTNQPAADNRSAAACRRK